MDYITIAEYAERAEISKQAAYNRAKSAKYKGYFRKIKGMLMVDTALLSFNQNFNLDSTVERADSCRETEKVFNQNSTDFSTVENLIERLKAQIESQTKQIESLYSMIREKDSIIKDLSANMATITATIQTLQHEQHLIEAGKVQAETALQQETIQTETKEENRTIKALFSRFWKR